MSGTFLSIDLDYWSTVPNAKKFLRRVKTLFVEVRVVDDHHLLLPFVNKCGSVGVDKLVNVDYHDDLVHTGGRRLRASGIGDGTWVSSVSWAKNGTYEWRYPSHDSAENGVCSTGCWDDWDGDEKKNTPWKRLSRRRGLEDLDWVSIKAVGISISSDYWRGRRGAFYELVDYVHKNLCFSNRTD